jgi:hypothetical protein
MAAGAARLAIEAPVPGTLKTLDIALVSGLEGGPLTPGLDLRAYLAAQAMGKVDFIGAARCVAESCDLMVEVGPGAVLTGLVGEIGGPDGPACFPVAAREETADRDLNELLARAFVMGARVDWVRLYEGRLVRPYVPASRQEFLDNPCERPFPKIEDAAPSPMIAREGSLEAMLSEASGLGLERLRAYLGRRSRFLAEVVRADMNTLDDHAASQAAPSLVAPEAPTPPSKTPAPSAISVGGEDFEARLIDLASERTGFPRDSITPEARLLDALNLDSIKAAELVAQATKAAGVEGLLDPSGYANASLSEVASAVRAAVAGRADGPKSTGPRLHTAMPVEARALCDDGPSWVRIFVIECVAEAA